ncbi:hypothetical protein HDU80_006663 [Chytriomyces hyalinus]|nr:hypothetical protein HDU80_006663 [Chytriomyces hyalinus]
MLKRPSEYIRERSQTIEERLIQTSFYSQVQKSRIIELVSSSDSITKVSDVPIDRPLFEPIPSEVILQSYEPFQNYEVVISFRNNDKFARRIKIEPIEHSHFKITGLKSNSTQSGKIAPGMEAQFLLKFTPEETVDYVHNLVCVTEREKFLVPIRAYGARGLLDFPDEIAFSDCPIRFITTRTLFVRNIGNRPAKFVIDVEPPFEASPDSGFLDVNKNMQIDVHFKSETSGSFSKDMLVKYDTGEIVRVALTGNAEDANIRLEKTSIRMESTYITLSSMKTIRIFNRSDKMTKFQWKTFATTAEDRQNRLKRKLAVDKQEEVECLAFYNQLATNQSLSLCDLSPITQKCKNKRREIENDILLFNDLEYCIQPIEGTIWPNSHVDVYIVFNPKKAGPNTTSVYCEVTGRQSRLPLVLKGDGIGPKGRFSCDTIEVNEVFINTHHTFEVYLENRGDIDFNFSKIKPDTLFGPKFTFTPERGLLKVGQQQLIKVFFTSDILGTFSEVLQWELEGAPERLTLLLNGRVIGPTFHFEIPQLDFGQLSYGFPTAKSFKIHNTSQISMVYNLRMNQEAGFDGLASEFSIVPQFGTIPPMSSAAIKVHFTPKSVKKYAECICVDVDSVGENLQQLPIFADSIVPKIDLTTPVLDYGDCFLAYTYQKEVELRNDTNFSAKYELLSQEETAKSVYAYSSKNVSGVILPQSSAKIEIAIQIKRLGFLNFPIFIKVTGNEEIPLGVDIEANGIGPNVIFSTMELNWGKIPVLKESISHLSLKNDSPTPAIFSCATVSESSVFKIEPLFGTIAPGASVNITATAFLDDSLKFTDILKIGIQSDRVHEVQLVARGQGSTVTFDEGLRNIEFHDVFSNRECSREFVLVNRGRRTQTLHWLGDEDRFSKKDASILSGPTFEVIPSRFLLKPNGQQVIVVKGYSGKALQCKETLVCQATMEKDPARRIIVETCVSANFINPLLDMSPPILKFISAQTNEEDFDLLSQALVLRNTSLLPLHLSFKCPIPYTVEPNEVGCRLNPSESISLKVSYDPHYNTNRISCKEHSKLWITYDEHPQRDFIELFSEITFPNMKFSTSEVCFGCIPNNTEQRKSFVITNTSSLPVEYNWYFLEDSIKIGSPLDPIQIAQVFDILPMRGVLFAGESETVEVSFFGHPNNTFSAVALCDVSGGPKYELELKGEASIIDYTFDKQLLDFGVHMYQDILEQEINITNTGNVTFDYNTILFPTSSLWQKVLVFPCTGTVPPHGKQKISVRFCSCVPETVDEFFYIQIALFEPIKVRVTGTGIFPVIHMSIPRVSDPKYEAALNDVRSSNAKAKKPNVLDKRATIIPSDVKVDEKAEAELEAKAERIILKEKTSKFLSEIAEDVKQTSTGFSKSKAIGSAILLAKSLQKSKDKRSVNTISETSEVVLSKYVCNFGNVIRNTVKKKSFKLTNRSVNAVTFQLDKSVLMGTGFSIEPDRVKLLPGKPHYESVDFQVTFQARSQTIGVFQIDLPINVLGGPTIILTLQADVTLPDLQLSTTEIDFGEVMCGLRKSVAIQLYNKNSVPCEWSTTSQEFSSVKSSTKAEKSLSKKRNGLAAAKEFDFTPKVGTLQPGEKLILNARFSSNEDKEYDSIIPLRINMNNQSIPIHLHGKGSKPVIQFEPESLVMGPILPCSDGTEGKFSIFNPTNYAIEVYSLEFDQLYEEEEEILRHIDGYEGNLLFLTPREPGQPLPDHIVESATANMKKKTVAAPVPETVLVNRSNEVAGVGELVESVPRTNLKSATGEVPRETPVSIIIHGPPFSGKTTQSKKLATMFDMAYIKIDEVLDESWIPETTVSKVEEKREDKRVSTVRNPAAEDEVRKPASEFEPVEEPKVVTDEEIAEILRLRFKQDDCLKGFVIDDLESRFYSSPTALLKILMRVLGDKRKTIFVNMNLDSSQIKEREAHVQKTSGEHEFDPMHVKDVSEEEYDNMTDIEREHYDIALMKYKKKMKELQDKRKNERRLIEEEIALKVGERKAEEEHMKSGKKKTGKRVTPRIGEKQEKPMTTSQNKADSKTGGKSERTGTFSPKTAKKLLDKDSKDLKVNDKSDKQGASDIEDFASPFNEVGQTYIHDSTWRRLDVYAASVDVIVSALRDVDKLVTNRPITSSANIEKKTGPKEKEKDKDKKSATVPAEAVAPQLNFPEGEVFSPEEVAGVTYHDVSASMDQESVFKTISEWLPSAQKAEETAIVADLIPLPFVEQIIAFPTEREPQTRSRNFHLLPPSQADGDEEGGPSVELASKSEIVLSPVAPVPQASPVTATMTGGGNSKKNRAPIKVAEEIKPVDEVLPEEEAPTKFRWILNPKERKELTVKFNATEIGKFEQTLQFEINGSRVKYPISCVGLCRYAVMSSDYKKMFPKWRKVKEDKYISHGEYIVSSGTFEFGPLLYSKPREKYLEKFPENRAILNIANPSQQDIKISICLKNDVKSDAFFFDPQTMDLAPGQTQQLSIWAYPRSANFFEDTLIFCVKDNPEPYTYKIACVGVKPELEIDKRQLSFDKLLLGRSERREIKLKNNTLMPVSWKLVQVELLGEEFIVSPTEGVIEPFLEQIITADFKGTKPVVISRRSIKLEVSDTEKIGGVVQEVSIMITAEAYDIAMDLHFPKGYDGGLDFGVLKVLEEGKQVCTLKNKGKYEVGFRFIFESKELAEIFSIVPAQGIMQPSDKPFAVQVIVKASREMHVRDNTNLKCQFYEPATGEVTATIPVKLQVRSVFSRFSILPVRDLNFGALVHGTKATRQFTIENQGEFDFKYSIYKMIQGINESRNDKKLRTQSRTSKGPRPLSPPVQKTMNRKEVVKQADATNFGAFTVFPTTSVIAAGAKHQITVEFHSESPGSFEETVAIDISDRSPNDYMDVIEYRLVAEDCIPGINTADFSSIFEEQTVCKRLELFNMQSNVYAEEDRVFYFGAFLAGHQAQVRFKISNPFKVPCDVSISTKPRTRTKLDAVDFAFDVEPKRLTVPSHEYRYITAYFHPTSIQSYAGIFEAIVENVDQSKSKTLTFELRGEGTLPRVTVEKPTLKNKNGFPLLKFKRLLVGASQILPITLKNEGITTAKVKLEWAMKEQDEFDCAGINTYHSLRPQETKSIEVKCRAISIRKFETDLKIRVLDNSFEDTIIQLSGEGYIDDLTFDELPSDSENEVSFGDCFIGESKTITFAVSNHSADVIRINWSMDIADFVFTPTVAHIRPKSKKEVSISFCAKQQAEFVAVKALCKCLKIKYATSGIDFDWDDKASAVKWTSNEGASVAPRKVIELYPEPQYEILSNALPERNLLMSANADFSSFECDVSNIKFKSTLMYQTRAFKFTLKNPGKVVLKFSFAIYADDGQALDLSPDELPFSVTPKAGSLEAGDTMTVLVKFAPLEDGVYSNLLVCHMQNLVKDTKPIAIKVSGTSLRPFCHFELEDSDYITSERRSPETSLNSSVPLSLPPQTKVIEFESCGVKVRNTKRFYIVNPTSFNYEFEWIGDANQDQKVFRCMTPHGTVMSNKKFEIVFEFIPETVDLKESFWKFSIPDHNIVIPFLLVGQALEPNVYIDRVSVNFKSLLVGRQVKEVVKLINNEAIPFAFGFNETSFEVGGDQTPVMKFHPTSGTIGGHSEIPIEITFTPSAEKMFNFNLLCSVKKKPTPLSINVKGEGYEIHESLQSELMDGTTFDLSAGPNAENLVDFGQVQLNEKRLKRVTIINSGKFNLDFAWKFLSKASGVLTIEPEIGTVPKGGRVVCEIMFMPTNNLVLKNVKAVCQIVNGQMYPLSILGSGSKPLLKFSANAHNFGTQFVYRSGMVATSTKIRITNQDLKDITIDVTSRETGIFDVRKGLGALAPGESTDLDIAFYPKEAISYSEVIKVEINGLSTMNVCVTGVGADFKVEMLQPDSKNINFGAIRVGHVVSRSIKLVNKSIIPAKFHLGPASAVESLINHCIGLSQIDDFILRPKGVAVIELRFSPQARIAPFAEELFLEAPGISKPLCLVSGACQGIEVKLENDTLPFGAIVQKSFTTRRIQLQNSGDIGAKFHWDAAKFAPDFSISTPEGYISPGMEIPLDITFHPVELNQDIRYDSLVCQIEGAPSLYLTLTGMCIPQPIQNDVIKFSTPVRQSDVKSVKIENKTSTLWHIRPIIENDNWSGPEFLDIEPNQTKLYDITFTPLELMGGGDGGRHEGSIFFPLPDGTGLLYKLNGSADKPVSVGTVTRDIPCKTAYTEVLTVTNWLKKPQRFRAVIEFAKSDPSTILKGLDFIDVPGLLTREYKLSYYAFKEGVMNAKVIFKNEQTQEFLFYNLVIKSTSPGVISTIDMATSVRQACSREISISNPLSTPVTFNAACPHPDVTVPHTFVVQPKCDGACLFEFLPLQPKEATTRVTVTSSDLGIYQYDLKLAASVAGPERSLHFKVGLGGAQTQTFRFLSFAKTKTEYACKIESPEFTVEKSVVAPSASVGGVEVCVDVTYEPSKLGDIRTQLLLTSSVGGDYVCPLFGHCTTPRPQGPITIKPGSTASVSFKNVYTTPAAFTFVMDNPAFTVKATETIPPKKVITMAIAAVMPATNSTDAKTTKVGKLTVVHKGSNVSWVYYCKTG